MLLHEFSEPSYKEVLNTIRFSPSKSSSTDPLPTRLVNTDAQLHAVYLLEVAKASFNTGIVPTVFKSSHITPVLKTHTRDGTVLTNYRRMNNLPFAATVLEHMVSCRISKLLKENNILDSCK
jgi:hypothetical protein